MKYVARPLTECEENANVGASGILNEVAWLGLASVILCFGVYLVLGAAVNLTLAYIPSSLEAPLGSAFLKLILSEKELPSIETEQTIAIQNLFAKVVSQAEGLPYSAPQLYINTSPIENAVTLPNCNIVMFSGLIDNASSENELAMIIAHELGHCKTRDNLKALGRTLVVGVMAVAVMGESSEVTKLLLSSLQLSNLAYSREQEENADLFALNTLYKVYNHVGGALEFFKRSAEDDKFETLEKLTNLNSTHPTNLSRIANLNYEIAKRSLPTNETIPWPHKLRDKVTDSHSSNASSDVSPDASPDAGCQIPNVPD